MLKYIFVLILLVGCTSKKENILKQYENAHNEHNKKEALSLLSDNIEFELIGTWTKTGKESMAELEDWDAAVNSHLEFTVLKEAGDTLFCSGIEENDWFNLTGIGKLEYKSIVYIIQNGLIQKIIASPSPEIGEKFNKVMNDLMSWSQANNDTTIYGLIPKGEFIYSTESAEKWIELLNRWRAETKHE